MYSGEWCLISASSKARLRGIFRSANVSRVICSLSFELTILDGPDVENKRVAPNVGEVLYSKHGYGYTSRAEQSDGITACSEYH